MKVELFTPIYYSIKRDMLKLKHSFKISTIRFLSSLFRDYLWVPVFTIFYLEGIGSYQILGLILHLFVFSTLYEAGYIFTDNLAIKWESEHIKKVIYKDVLSNTEVYSAILLRLIITIGFLLMMKPWTNIIIYYLYTGTALAYLSHGFFKERFRFISFFLLRVLKGFTPYAFLILLLPMELTDLVVITLCSVSLYHTILYRGVKLGLPFINIYYQKYFWIRYVMLGIFVSIFTFFNKDYLYWVFILLIIYSICHSFISVVSYIGLSFFKVGNRISSPKRKEVGIQ